MIVNVVTHKKIDDLNKLFIYTAVLMTVVSTIKLNINVIIKKK